MGGLYFYSLMFVDNNDTLWCGDNDKVELRVAEMKDSRMAELGCIRYMPFSL